MASLDTVDMREVFRRRAVVMRTVPVFLKGALSKRRFHQGPAGMEVFHGNLHEIAQGEGGEGDFFDASFIQPWATWCALLPGSQQTHRSWKRTVPSRRYQRPSRENPSGTVVGWNPVWIVEFTHAVCRSHVCRESHFWGASLGLNAKLVSANPSRR